MKIVGHDSIIAQLDKDVPPVSLFLGPKGVGRFTTAMWTVERLGVPWEDVIKVDRLNAETMTMLERFAKRSGSTESGQVAIVRLGRDVLEYRPRLMVTLEQVRNTRFILIGEDMPTKAISSRSVKYRFGLLKPEHVAEILENRGAKPAEAIATASYSSGSMDILWLAKQVTEVKPLVQQVLRALHARDAESLEMHAPRWSEVATQWLARWCSERYTGRWRWFNDEFTEIEDPKSALRILLAISQDVRPALVVRSSLMTLIKE